MIDALRAACEIEMLTYKNEHPNKSLKERIESNQLIDRNGCLEAEKKPRTSNASTHRRGG
jgi:hypothetical protein